MIVTSDDDEVVDTKSQGFFHDEVDEFISNKEKILLDGASDVDEGHKTWEDDDVCFPPVIFCLFSTGFSHKPFDLSFLSSSMNENKKQLAKLVQMCHQMISFHS